MNIEDMQEAVREMVVDRVKGMVAAELRRLADEYETGLKRKTKHRSKRRQPKHKKHTIKAAAQRGPKRRKHGVVLNAVQSALSNSPAFAYEIVKRVQKTQPKLEAGRIVKVLSQMYAGKKLERTGSFGKYQYYKSQA